MDTNAFRHAAQRLQKAENAFLRLEAADSFDVTEEAWSDFLLAASAIYSKLEQGSKSSGKSSAWYGRMKHQRRTDPLLSYLHHARNSEEHGIADITDRSGAATNVDVDMGMGGFTIAFDGVPEELEISDQETGEVFPYRLSVRRYVKLVPVQDERYHDTFEVPELHMGESISVDEPLGIATLAIYYLRDLVKQAEALVM